MKNKERYDNLMALGDFCMALANREGNRIRGGEENTVIENGFCLAVQATAQAYGCADVLKDEPNSEKPSTTELFQPVEQLLSELMKMEDEAECEEDLHAITRTKNLLAKR